MKPIWNEATKEWECPECGFSTFLVAEVGTHFFKAYLGRDGDIDHMQSENEDVEDSTFSCFDCRQTLVMPNEDE